MLERRVSGDSPLSTLTHGDSTRQALIFLHGFLGTKEDWHPLIQFLHFQFFCIAVDLPGHGSSPFTPDWNGALSQTLAALPPLVDPTLVGYSMGGRFALRYPCEMRRILLSTHLGLDTPEEKKARLEQDLLWASRLIPKMTQKLVWGCVKTSKIDDREAGCIINTARFPIVDLSTVLTQPHIQFLNHFRYRDLPLSAVYALWYQQPLFQSLQTRPDLMPYLFQRPHRDPFSLAQALLHMSLAVQERVAIPPLSALFLCGEKDEKFLKLYRDWQIGCRIIPGAGHVLHLENPEACAQIFWES